MKLRSKLLLASFLAGSFTAAARADGIDEVGNWFASITIHDLPQAARNEPMPGTIFPPLLPGLSTADINFVANRSSLTPKSGFTLAQLGVAFGALEGGNFGMLGTVLIGNPSTVNDLDLTDSVVLFDFTSVASGAVPSTRNFHQLAPTNDPEGDFDMQEIISANPPGDTTFGGLGLPIGFVIESNPNDDAFPDEPLRAFSLAAAGVLGPGQSVETVWAMVSSVPVPADDCNGNWIADSGETDSDGDGVIDDCDLCPGDVPGDLDVNSDGCTDTTTDVAIAMEQILTPQFQQTIDDILTDPDIPDEIADDIQAALNDVIGNAGGNANNGAVDKLLETGDLVAAVVKAEAAIEDLQAAAAQGFDTTDLQQLVADFASLGVLAAIVEAESVLGSGDPAVVAAQDFFAAGDALLTTGDFLGALVLYKAAAQEIT